MNKRAAARRPPARRDDMAQSNHMGRLAEDMKRELIDIISHMKDPRVNGLLTVMRVEVTPDPVSYTHLDVYKRQI